MIPDEYFSILLQNSMGKPTNLPDTLYQDSFDKFPLEPVPEKFIQVHIVLGFLLLQWNTITKSKLRKGFIWFMLHILVHHWRKPEQELRLNRDSNREEPATSIPWAKKHSCSKFCSCKDRKDYRYAIKTHPDESNPGRVRVFKNVHRLGREKRKSIDKVIEKIV